MIDSHGGETSTSTRSSEGSLTVLQPVVRRSTQSHIDKLLVSAAKRNPVSAFNRYHFLSLSRSSIPVQKLQYTVFLTDRLTIVWYDGPGHSGCIDLSNHPEHTQPAEVFSSFLPGQHLCKEGENNGHSTSYPARTREDGKVSGSEADRIQIRTETHLYLYLSQVLLHCFVPLPEFVPCFLFLLLKRICI